jgi:hypothetical protein
MPRATYGWTSPRDPVVRIMTRRFATEDRGKLKEVWEELESSSMVLILEKNNLRCIRNPRIEWDAVPVLGDGRPKGGER